MIVARTRHLKLGLSLFSRWVSKSFTRVRLSLLESPTERRTAGGRMAWGRRSPRSYRHCPRSGVFHRAPRRGPLGHLCVQPRAAEERAHARRNEREKALASVAPMGV